MNFGDFQQLVFSTLNDSASLAADLGGAGRIHDSAPPERSFPLVVIGETEASDWATADRTGAALIQTLRIWTRDDSRLQAYAIADNIASILSALAPVEQGTVRVVSLAQTSLFAERDRVNRAFLVELRFRALCEPTE